MPRLKTLALLTLLASTTFAMPPRDAIVATDDPASRLVLLAPLDAANLPAPGGYQFTDGRSAVADPALGVKFGLQAVTLTGRAISGGGKGDFDSHGRPGPLQSIGCWVHLAPALGEGANVKSVGFQLYDKGGEAFIYLRDADWTGWKWIETPVSANALKHAYTQKDADGSPDLPIRSIKLVWFVRGEGPTAVTFDGLFGRVAADPAQTAPSLDLSMPADLTPGSHVAGLIMLTNPAAAPTDAKVELQLQADARLYDDPVPDPVLGRDHALEASSWTVAEDQIIARNTLTDGVDYTAAETAYKGNYWKEAWQYVKLDQPRRITALGWLSGDANWVWKVDVEASQDGQAFTPVAGLQGVDMHKKWGGQRFPAFEPFQAAMLRLHYHNGGELTNVIRMPSALMVYDGAADESFAIPQAGLVVAQQQVSVQAGPRSLGTATFKLDEALKPGVYLLAARVTSGGQQRLEMRHVMVEPATTVAGSFDSRFGLNSARSSLAPEHRKLGIGWVRFENFKWPMVSPAPHRYAYDGSVKPWVVNVDQIVRDYRNAELNVIPMMFLTPDWAAVDEPKADKKIRHSLPPKDNEDFGEFAFQSVARFGSKKHDPSELKTDDKVSGLGLIKVFELGNEPNLNPRKGDKLPGWGAWAGTMDEFWEMFRHGVAGIRRADPDAIVSSPGFAGCTVEVVDALRHYRYSDGSCPLDLVDLINVHFYSGRTPPERATRDANTASAMDVTFEEHLQRLMAWRDQCKPGAPVWMTETGYDSGGPIGTNERLSAARLPRVIMLCLANGVEKVIVYREMGSTPAQHAAAGVLRNDESRKPGWYTYATLIRQLDQVTPGEHLVVPDDNVRVQSWTRDGKLLLSVWAITGTAKLDLDLGSATVTDAFGGVRQVTGTRGLPLSEFPQYLTDIANPAALQPLIARAKAAREAAAQQRRAEAERSYCLFNFGAALEPVGTYLGTMRYFQDVPAATLYDAKAGFGFLGHSTGRDGQRHWYKRPLGRTEVTMMPGQAFRFDVKPGKYEVALQATPHAGSGGKLVIEGGKTGPVEIDPNNSDEGQSVTLDVTGDNIIVRATHRVTMYWLIAKGLEK